MAGGLLTQTFEIGNWLGTQNILGNDFARLGAEHVKSYGAEIRPETVERLEQKFDKTWHITLVSGSTIEAKTILFATGTQHRHLGVPGEHELAGKGVSYCPTCDGFFFRKKTVAVVGGGDSAASAGVYLAGICERVYIIVREGSMLAERFWQESLMKLPNVEIFYETNVIAIEGENKVEYVRLDKPYKENNELAIDGVFIEIGLKPSTQLVDTLGIEKDAYGYIVTGADQSTSLENLWAAGDITTNSNRFHQIVTAASEGAIAANSILTHLQRG